MIGIIVFSAIALTSVVVGILEDDFLLVIGGLFLLILQLI